jgi:tetratricopeptide (TPR) repeat protein
MRRFFGELQRRGVLRGAGLYIAFLWLLLQVGDVVLPAFELPDSVLRYALYIGFAGLPVVLVLSWFYELTSEGIVTEEEARDHGTQGSSNQLVTIATIFFLVVALGISLYMNYRQAADTLEEPLQVVSLLVADIDNQTGDPLFDGSLEAALAIGLEGASFVNSYPRHNAVQVAKRINQTDKLDEETARLVSVREDIDLVLTGSIIQTDDGYELSQRAVDPLEGALIAKAEASAGSKPEVLPAIGELAAQIREALGDVTLEEGTLAVNETFTSTSLKAVKYFTQGQTYAFREENIQAIDYFEKAIAEDPDFGRAYTAWAHSEFKLGRREKAEQLWQEALSRVDSMTERERYRTLGLYYSSVTGNQRKAIENYELLVEKYPADAIGWNNLGVNYFLVLEFDKAMEVGGQLEELFPGNPAFQANYALFAMYAGDFALGRREAEDLLQEQPEYFLAYLPVAIADISEGAIDAAISVYDQMAEQGDRAKSFSITGLADIAFMRGDFAEAATLLENGRESDQTFGNSLGHAYKGIYLAGALAAAGEREAALDMLDSSVAGNTQISHLVPAALYYIELGAPEKAEAIQAALAANLQGRQRAAAEFIAGALALDREDYVAAVDSLTESLERVDFWLTRFYLGKAYALAGSHAEALGEFELCMERIGESSALFLDDVPTFQYHAPLYYWLGRTRQAMGSPDGAARDLDSYLSLRLDSDTSAATVDARSRLNSLKPAGGS